MALTFNFIARNNNIYKNGKTAGFSDVGIIGENGIEGKNKTSVYFCNYDPSNYHNKELILNRIENGLALSDGIEENVGKRGYDNGDILLTNDMNMYIITEQQNENSNYSHDIEYIGTIDEDLNSNKELPDCIDDITLLDFHTTKTTCVVPVNRDFELNIKNDKQIHLDSIKFTVLSKNTKTSNNDTYLTVYVGETEDYGRPRIEATIPLTLTNGTNIINTITDIYNSIDSYNENLFKSNFNITVEDSSTSINILRKQTIIRNINWFEDNQRYNNHGELVNGLESETYKHAIFGVTNESKFIINSDSEFKPQSDSDSKDTFCVFLDENENIVEYWSEYQIKQITQLNNFEVELKYRNDNKIIKYIRLSFIEYHIGTTPMPIIEFNIGNYQTNIEFITNGEEKISFLYTTDIFSYKEFPYYIDADGDENYIQQTDSSTTYETVSYEEAYRGLYGIEFKPLITLNDATLSDDYNFNLRISLYNEKSIQDNCFSLMDGNSNNFYTDVTPPDPVEQSLSNIVKFYKVIEIPLYTNLNDSSTVFISDMSADKLHLSGNNINVNFTPETVENINIQQVNTTKSVLNTINMRLYTWFNIYYDSSSNTKYYTKASQKKNWVDEYLSFQEILFGASEQSKYKNCHNIIQYSNRFDYLTQNGNTTGSYPTPINFRGGESAYFSGMTIPNFDIFSKVSKSLSKLPSTLGLKYQKATSPIFLETNPTKLNSLIKHTLANADGDFNSYISNIKSVNIYGNSCEKEYKESNPTQWENATKQREKYVSEYVSQKIKEFIFSDKNKYEIICFGKNSSVGDMIKIIPINKNKITFK